MITCKDKEQIMTYGKMEFCYACKNDCSAYRDIGNKVI